MHEFRLQHPRTCHGHPYGVSKKCHSNKLPHPASEVLHNGEELQASRFFASSQPCTTITIFLRKYMGLQWVCTFLAQTINHLCLIPTDYYT